MSRVPGKKYSSSTLSGYKTKEEAEQHVLRNYSSVAVEVETVGSDFVFYFEDPNGQLYSAKRGVNNIDTPGHSDFTFPGEK